MNINYDKELIDLISHLDANEPKKLLLHACCAPCSTYCLTQVLTHFDVTLYYANDNITDNAEWEKRLGELYKLVDIVNGGKFVVEPLRQLKLIVQPFDAARFFAVAKGKENEKEGGSRCNDCFTLRLSDTLKFAVKNCYDYFGTTLSVSPYKNSQRLNEIGASLETDTVKWLYADFKKRDGYKQSIELSQKYELYRQHYCGCASSAGQLDSIQS